MLLKRNIVYGLSLDELTETGYAKQARSSVFINEKDNVWRKNWTTLCQWSSRFNMNLTN